MSRGKEEVKGLEKVKSEQKFYFKGWFTSIGSHLRHKEQFWVKNYKFGLS